MNYDFPAIPKGQRWRVTPSAVRGLTRVILEEKRWWGWKKIEYTVVSNENLASSARWTGNYILEKANAKVEYGVQEGML